VRKHAGENQFVFSDRSVACVFENIQLLQLDSVA
jgi:hypothetical protein